MGTRRIMVLAAVAAAVCGGGVRGAPQGSGGGAGLGVAAATRPAFVPGERVGVEDLLAEFAYRTGVIVAKADTIAGEVTVTREIPASPEQGVAALNEMLTPLQLRAVHVKNITSTRLSVRILGEAEARKEELQNGPVTLGADPRKIDVSERGRMVTHILPVHNPDLLETLRRTAAEAKEVGATAVGTPRDGVRLILTGPALAVRGVVERAATLDPAPVAAAAVGPAMVRSIQLKRLEAEGTAAILNNQFGRDAAGNEVLRALANPRTNSIVLTGQDLDVVRAVQLLQRMDEAAPGSAAEAPRVVVPPPPQVAPGPAPTPANPGTRPAQ